MSTDTATSAHAPRSRYGYALLALLLLLVTAASALHPYASDDHVAGEICGPCLANANGGDAPLPTFVLPRVPAALAPTQVCLRSAAASRTLPRHRARAPPA